MGYRSYTLEFNTLNLALYHFADGALSRLSGQGSGDTYSPTVHSLPPFMNEIRRKTMNESTVTFSSQTKIGDLVLPPGRYRLQHQGDGAEHFAEFTPISKTDSRTTGQASRTTCRAEPLDEKASCTTINWVKEGEVNRVTKIKLRGENVVHLF